LVSLLVLAALGAYFITRPAPQPPVTAAQEQPVELIQLAGPAADKSAEISGLGWFGETLILLPQYPERFGEGDGALFALPKTEILAYLDGKNSAPLTPRAVKLTAPGLKAKIPNFQGYEAVGFHDRQVFMTIEAGLGADMHGYLVRGAINPEGSEITLETSSLVEIKLPTRSENHTDEALVVTSDRILTFYEINGADLNPQPAAQVFDFDLKPQPSLSFPHLEYRVTDAALAPDGQIWVINYFFPGDTDLLPKADPLAATYGEGPTHAQYDQVERLVALKEGAAGLTLAEGAPIQLTLIKDARNWEGLALLDRRGFLLATDKFPGTLLGFVPLP
jgi:hypothetical protein